MTDITSFCERFVTGKRYAGFEPTYNDIEEISVDAKINVTCLILIFLRHLSL